MHDRLFLKRYDDEIKQALTWCHEHQIGVHPLSLKEADAIFGTGQTRLGLFLRPLLTRVHKGGGNKVGRIARYCVNIAEYTRIFTLVCDFAPQVISFDEMMPAQQYDFMNEDEKRTDAIAQLRARQKDIIAELQHETGLSYFDIVEVLRTFPQLTNMQPKLLT
jgi:hypothetical protein